MKDAGLIRMSYGLESGDPDILKLIKKEVSHTDMLNAFKLTSELGIEPACSVIIGLPGEKKKSVKTTIDFVKRIPEILYAYFSICNPYTGTEVYSWALKGKHGIRLKIDDYSDYRRYDHSPITVNDLSQKNLVKYQKIGLINIHIKPKRIIAAIKMIGFTTLVFWGIKFIYESLSFRIKK